MVEWIVGPPGIYPRNAWTLQTGCTTFCARQTPLLTPLSPINPMNPPFFLFPYFSLGMLSGSLSPAGSGSSGP